MTKHMTKQEIREDRVVLAAVKAWETVQRNSRWLIGALAVVAVVIIAAVLIAQGRVRAEKEAAAGMAQAQSLYFSGDFAPALTQFQMVAERHGSAPSAQMAQLFIGNCQLALGSGGPAEEAYRKFLGSNAAQSGVLKAGALRGLGGALMAQNRAAEAAEQYAQAAAVEGNPLAAEDWVSAGRAYAEAGQTTQALQAFDFAVEANPQSQAAAEARVRREEASASF